MPRADTYMILYMYTVYTYYISYMSYMYNYLSVSLFAQCLLVLQLVFSAAQGILWHANPEADVISLF